MPVLIEIKSPREIEKMRQAALICRTVLSEVQSLVQEGITTDILDKEARLRVSRIAGARPAFLGYRGFPASLCVSVNSEVVHGIPSAKKRIKDGDLVSLDFGVCHEGFYGDCASTVAVGEVKAKNKDLMRVTQGALRAALEVVREGARVGDIGWAIQSFVEAAGMNVIRDFVGHGIGRNLHEEPAVPNWGVPHDGVALVAGMTLAIEPMVALGGGEVSIDQDGWTARTKDGSWAAHFEETVLITTEGYEILTKLVGVTEANNER